LKEELMPRYTVCVIRDFVTQHYLIGGDWGRENQLHSHPYRLEMIFEGDELDRHEYLLDIAVVKDHLERLVERYRDKTLNDLPEFAGKNPSLELFARHLAEGMARALEPRNLSALTAKLWENADAFATHTVTFA
jgi:6-pyruvoyltetrahydropterin/6-carboxytetrahydropterin synthase